MSVGLYCRVSTMEQAREGYSIGEQKERLISYCEAMDWRDYKVYVDAGISGAKMERPALQDLIKDVKKGHVDKVIVYKLDRLSRSQKDTMHLIEDIFLANGCAFVSVSEKFDTSSPFGMAMVGILAVFAQLEREQIRERMTMGIYARAKSGKFVGSRIPIGYDYFDGELVVNEFERIQVVKVFEGYASGMTPRRIADMLNAHGYKTKYGEWKTETVRGIITNKVYIGYVNCGEELHRGIHEPIIDESLFNEVQKEHEKRMEAYIKHNRRNGKATSYLGGLLVCGCCGAKYHKRTYVRKRTTNPYKEYMYSCNSRTMRKSTDVKDPNCKNKHWYVDELDSLVFDEIRKLATDPSYYPQVKEEDETPAIIEAEIQKIDKQLLKVMDLFSLEKMPFDILQTKVTDLTEQRDRLQNELIILNKTRKRKLSQADAILYAESFADVLDHGDYEDIRQVIETLIDQIVIDGDDITIYWRFN